jgi:hypothetical protein
MKLKDGEPFYVQQSLVKEMAADIEALESGCPWFRPQVADRQVFINVVLSRSASLEMCFRWLASSLVRHFIDHGMLTCRYAPDL